MVDQRLAQEVWQFAQEGVSEHPAVLVPGADEPRPHLRVDVWVVFRDESLPVGLHFP